MTEIQEQLKLLVEKIGYELEAAMREGEGER